MPSTSGILRSLLITLALPVAAPAILAQDAPGVPVITAPVQERNIDRVVQVTGTVTAARDARLSVSIGGLVTALQVDAGSRVERGELLLSLDPELAQLQWQSAQASVAEARTALADARRRLQEARTLAPQQSIAETAVRDLEAEVARDQSVLARAEAEAGYRRAVLDRHELRAPFGGVITARQADPGEWVNPGQEVFQLVATDELRLDFEVPEDFLGDVGPDTRVLISLDAGSGAQHEGEVIAVVPVADPGDRTFLLRAQPRAPLAEMRPGMSARAELSLATGRRGLAVPRDAVLRFPDGRLVVWVVESSDQGPVAAERPIRTGLAFDGLVEVLAGLEPGAEVVIEGNEALLAGQPLAPQRRTD